MRSCTQGGIGECSTSAVKGFPDALGASTELADDDDYDKYVRHHAQHRSRSSPSRSRALEPPESPRQRSPSVSPDRRRHPNNSERAVSPCLFRSAYFSPRPPAAPLSLVLRRPLTPLEPYTPSPRPQKPQQTTQNHISRIPRSLESHRTPKSLRRSTQRRRGRRTVNLILRELMSTLPLPVTTTPSTAFNAPVSAAQAHDVRDVAVQAITT
ncbi:uncharacterized protein LOC132903971 [Amyelois transitella]|uniref:uncharacterized protein LOC132903971 n=1 Tax=Amyelois transitella TaxID=680683 RepID=UPI00298FC11C|nr:uncharacterized protein LOC132903971 [Amyelois transitella]